MSETAPRIAIVDDEKNILVTLGGLLRDQGYEIATAATGGEGLALLAGGRFDLAILDVRLPDLDGISLLERARAADPDLGVVMMSGHASIDIAVKAVRLGAYDFLEKPLSADRLLVVVRNALERNRLVAENRRLREERPADEMLGESPPMRELRRAIDRVAPTRGRVLILGESGTGKELVARALHTGSERADGPFVKLNCAAIPNNLIESALFGHEKGAFTGATASAPGKFEQAHRGTLLLDEVGDMHLDTQAKLLRVLEAGELERVGGRKTIPVDVRVLAATNKDPRYEIEEGRFREDLYFRLAVVPLAVPPLRERGDDIALIARHFLARFAREYGRPAPKLSAAATRALGMHRWPGNVRELRNLMERTVILTRGDSIGAEEVTRLLAAAPAPRRDPGSAAPMKGPLAERLAAIERRWIEEALERSGGRVADAARALHVDRANLHRKMRRLGIVRDGDPG